MGMKQIETRRFTMQQKEKSNNNINNYDNKGNSIKEEFYYEGSDKDSDYKDKVNNNDNDKVKKEVKYEQPTTKTGQQYVIILENEKSSDLVRNFVRKKLEKTKNQSFFKQLYEDLIYIKENNQLII